MSTSPHDPLDEAADKQSLDELDDTNHVVDTDAGVSLAVLVKSMSFTPIVS